MSYGLENLVKFYGKGKEVDKMLYRCEYRNKMNVENEDVLLRVLEGDWNGRHFVIGGHRTGNPNAYVQIFDEKEKVTAWCCNSIDGGITYNYESDSTGKAYWNNEDNRKYVGWDYGHSGDYNSYCDKPEEIGDDCHKWSLTEIMMQISAFIAELETMKDYMEEESD